MKLKDHLSTGNKKVPYYIFNITSALECPSEKAGMCPVADICYAKKAERAYKQVKPYRDRQTVYWDSVSAIQFVTELEQIQARSRTMQKVLRYSEAGDFRDQDDVYKMASIAHLLKAEGWKVYGYTARTDLDLSELIQYAQVNLSNDHDGFQSEGANRFKVVDQPSGDNFVCRGDCRKCRVCINMRGKTIEVIKH